MFVLSTGDMTEATLQHVIHYLLEGTRQMKLDLVLTIAASPPASASTTVSIYYCLYLLLGDLMIECCIANCFLAACNF